MSKLIVALIVGSFGAMACGPIPGTVAVAPSTPTARASASASAVPAAVLVTATPAPVQATPVPAAPTAPPPAAPTAKPAPAIKAVPLRAARGSTFVLQFSGFPTSPGGVDVVQTVTLPNGVRLAPTTFLAKPDGTGFTTYLASLGDPAGQHVVQLAGAGASAQVVLLVD